MPASYGDQPCQDVAIAIKDTQRLGLSFEPWGRLANGYKCSLGVKPGEADILLTASQLLVLANNRPDFSITSPYSLVFESQGEFVIIPTMSVVAAVTCHPSHADDPFALYHVRLADKRYLMAKYPLDRKYNIRVTPTGPYVDDTIDSGNAYTWASMIGDMWGYLPVAYAGICPTTENFPTDFVPENFDFEGWYALDAIGFVLDRLALALAFNPITGQFSFVRPGDPQTDVANAIELYSNGNRLIDDAGPIEPVPGRIPASIRVQFPIQPLQAYGRDRYYTIDVADPDGSLETLTNSIEFVVDDMPAMYQGLSTLTNLTDLQARATLRADEWYKERRSGISRMNKRFSGALSAMVPGSLTKCVWWRDGGQLAKVGIYDGMTTEITKFGPGASAVWQGNRDQPYNLTEVVEVVNSSPNSDGYLDCLVKLYDTTTKTFVTAFPAWGKEANS